MVDPLCLVLSEESGEEEEQGGAAQHGEGDKVVSAVVLLRVDLQVELLPHGDHLLLLPRRLVVRRVAGSEVTSFDVKE